MKRIDERDSNMETVRGKEVKEGTKDRKRRVRKRRKS
jgi:hypothetical protein